MCSLRVMSLFTVLKETLPPNSKLPISLLKFKLNLVLYTFSLIWPQDGCRWQSTAYNGSNGQNTRQAHNFKHRPSAAHTHTALSKW